MINSIPHSWKYNESMEMLLFFYQCSDELLSETTPDTYSLPMHNSITLVLEMDEVYNLLVNHGELDKYYERYLSPIIDEFIESLSNDYILKRIIGDRLQSITTGFSEAKKNHEILQRWIDVLQQVCTPGQYYRAYKKEIIHLITETKEKRKLMQCTAIFYICLINAGYSREFLYISSKKYFDNYNITIDNTQKIVDYLDQFGFEKKEFQFLYLMNIDSIEYMNNLIETDRLSLRIRTVDQKEEAELMKDDICASVLRECRMREQKAGKHEKIALVRTTDHCYDPYTSATEFIEFITSLQSYTRYFKHYYFSQQVFRILLQQESGSYQEIKLPHRLHKRPYVEQDIIDNRIKNILTRKSMGKSAYNSINKAIAMHAEAYDARSTTAVLRTFWTALETLFSNPITTSTRENAMYSVLPIIQKTYILKRLRTLYYQIKAAIDTEELNSLNIYDFQSFIIYFVNNNAVSDGMKKLCSFMPNNPLLRSRVYGFRNEIESTASIRKLLEDHEKKVTWQLQRIYRIRNIATHLGREITGIQVAAIHLHNYFDYVVNYMLCKSENGNYVVSTASVVFESQNDIRLHMEELKIDVT